MLAECLSDKLKTLKFILRGVEMFRDTSLIAELECAQFHEAWGHGGNPVL